MMMPTITYKTHFLIGTSNMIAPTVVGRWEYVPKQAEMAAAIATATKSFTVFVLVAPVGDPLPGNYETPAPIDYSYCG